MCMYVFVYVFMCVYVFNRDHFLSPPPRPRHFKTSSSHTQSSKWTERRHSNNLEWARVHGPMMSAGVQASAIHPDQVSAIFQSCIHTSVCYLTYAHCCRCSQICCITDCKSNARVLCKACDFQYFCTIHARQFHEHGNFSHDLQEWIEHEQHFQSFVIVRSKRISPHIPSPCACHPHDLTTFPVTVLSLRGFVSSVQLHVCRQRDHLAQWIAFYGFVPTAAKEVNYVFSTEDLHIINEVRVIYNSPGSK